MTNPTKFCMGCMEKFGDECSVCPYCGFIEGTQAEEALHMEPESILSERYIIGKVLGFGGFGVTYIGWDAVLEQKVAIKEYLPSEFSTRAPGHTKVSVFSGDKAEQFDDGRFKFIDEARKLAKFHNEMGIVKIYDCFEDNNTAYIIMEYLQGETLKEHLGREKTIPADTAIEMLSPIIHSLAAVHEQGIIHRDIAPDNIFITNDGRVKLIDFGAARFATTTHSRSLSVLVKQGYSPEEQYRSKGDQGSHTDVYAIGATLYRMIVGIAPPDAMERRATFEGRKKDILKPISGFSVEITQNQETAILNALNVRIEDRTPDMETLAIELNTQEPEKVKRLYGKISKIDVLRWPIWAKISAPAAMFAVLMLGILFSLGVIGGEAPPPPPPEGMTRVPSVVNTPIDDAELRLTEAILLLSIVGLEHSSTVPADLVLLQNLQAGMLVMENEIVDVTVSGGFALALVPDIVGFESEKATSMLEELGFVVRFVEEYHNALARGSVISQSVEPGIDYALGDIITITVSMGPRYDIEQVLRAVPDFVGIRFEQALEEAERTGFFLTISTREYREDIPAGFVISQDIAARSELMTGSIIRLTVSLGLQVSRMPSVQFRTMEEAIRAVENEGLVPEITFETSDIVAEGVVISQFPEPGVFLEPGTVVSIVVSSGSGSFSMPNVVGQPESSAVEMLTELRLAVSIEREVSLNIPPGNVIRQSVLAGEEVTRGSQVVLTVAVEEIGQLVEIPNVVGGSVDNAVSMLYGFNVTINEIHHATVPLGNVISQTPSAGSMQLPNTSVSINVSLGPQMFTISFNANGGTPAPSDMSVSPGSSASLPSISRNGHMFDGWFSGGSRITELASVSSNMSLTAQWVANPWTDWTTTSPPANVFESESNSVTEYRYRDEIAWGSWSSWGETNPGSASDTMGVESQQEWRHRNMGSWSEWSGWSQSNPGAGTTTMGVEERQEWRRRDMGPWSEWSGWGTHNPGEGTSTMGVESRQEWRRRDMSAWTTWSPWSTSNPGAGTFTMEVESRQEWRQRTLGAWSAWSGYGTHNPGASNNDRIVEVSHRWHHYRTQWHYHRYVNDARNHTRPIPHPAFGGFPATHIRENTGWLNHRLSHTGDTDMGPRFGPHNGGFGSFLENFWYNEQPHHVHRNEWNFRTRSWSAWSGWSTTNPGAATNTMQVEQQIVYRTRTRSWGAWSSWGTTNPGAATSTMEVEQQTVWRNRTRSWSDWTVWSITNPGAATNVMEVEPRTLWRTRDRSWDGWSGWSTTNPGAATEVMEVEPRTLWRTRTRPARWESWSMWQEDVATESPTREVETRVVTLHRWILN